ncbi:MAG: site-specific integrase [Myxococcales bacterium]|nr:site-specific integrase [Myxococcales bacterium]
MPVHRDTRRKNRPWVIDISYVDRRTGKKVRYFRNAKLQTADGARAEERQLLVVLTEKGFIPTAKDFVPEEKAEKKKEMTLAEAWVLYEQGAGQQLKPSSLYGYKKVIEAHLLPRFGSWPLSKIDKAALLELDLDLLRDGVSVATRNNATMPLRSVVWNAIELGHHNVKPDFPPLHRVKSKVFEVLTIVQIVMLLAKAPEHVRTAIALAAYAGLRLSEVIGIRWADVNLDTDTLFVKRAITHGVVVTPKSGHQRAIPIAPALKDILLAARPERFSPFDPVAASRKGTVWTDSGLRHAFQKALKKAELPHSRFHDLRHFFVPQVFAGGAGAPTVQKLAGHLHLSVTQRYAHAPEELMRQAVQVFGRRSA